MFGFGSAGMVGVIRWMVGLGCGESVGQVRDASVGQVRSASSFAMVLVCLAFGA